MKFSILLSAVAALYITGADAACYCLSATGKGTFCGFQLTGDSCVTDHLYQCNGYRQPFSILLSAVAALYITGADAACYCLSATGKGTFCGFQLTGDSCVTDHLYQCNGYRQPVFQDLGKCANGCQGTYPSQSDHCK
ncbi:hypothetical protein K493DRAFT_357262 [Basidiobolus meristosporus CBS 931.73]|uniref:Uncharacterized protein n=1 Tax=Basidiobolus meristosporus CBS 931.73 TaxID=1314790 RepID=A0A1Y1XX96_9FUNG|nr:hypothetical protein K493DRAFT_357262 [Basidiobolus meristosporus CBS 931.73]|eukprot:ORX90086.1 hypothetical protein K493DRAFT_357262 [Basidiobolus meristosporus CBS 931.73]